MRTTSGNSTRTGKRRTFGQLYAKFYQETRRGQLMVLRSDEPKLHHYSEGRWKPEVAFAALQDRLARIHYTLRWLKLVLIAFGLFVAWNMR